MQRFAEFFGVRKQEARFAASALVSSQDRFQRLDVPTFPRSER